MDYQGEKGKIEDFNNYLNKIGSHIHSAFMPYCVFTPEFNESSRKYFLEKKEKKRGPFHLLAQNQKTHIDKVNQELSLLKNNLEPFYCSNKLTLLDILLASHLWGMYLVPEFQFSSEMHLYLQKVKEATRFNYHEDFWRNPL